MSDVEDRVTGYLLPIVQPSHPLPGVLTQVARTIDLHAAYKLALFLGGQSIHVPSMTRMSEMHPLMKVLGYQRGRMLSKHFQGEQIYVPRARFALTKLMAAAGMSTPEIAARLGINRSTVRRYRRRAGV